MLIVLLGRKCHISNSKANFYYECSFPFVFTWLYLVINSITFAQLKVIMKKNYDTFCWWLWKVKLTSNSTYGDFLKKVHKIQFIYRWNIIGQKHAFEINNCLFKNVNRCTHVWNFTKSQYCWIIFKPKIIKNLIYILS